VDKKTDELLSKMFGASLQSDIRELESTDPELFSLVAEIPIGKIWSREGISLREKSMITIASQAAMGRYDQVKFHMQSFLHLGGTKAELREICIHLAVYCGFPAMVACMKALREL
jgi:4-carboxymuconolactone decarboxylase